MSESITSIKSIEVEHRVHQFFMAEVERIGQRNARWRVLRGLLRPQLKIVTSLLILCGAIGAMAGSVTSGLIIAAILSAITLVVPFFYFEDTRGNSDVISAYESQVLRLRGDLSHSLDALRKEISAFNAALSARQHEDAALKGLAMYEDDVAQWHARYEGLSAKLDGLIVQLADASLECMSATDRRAEIADFGAKVERLRTLETGLMTLTPEEPTRGTKDYASFAVAAELRHRLEKEQQRLGLSPSALPPPKGKKLLKTAT